MSWVLVVAAWLVSTAVADPLGVQMRPGGATPLKLRFRPVAPGASSAAFRLRVGSKTHTFPLSAVGDPAAPLGMNNAAREVAIGDVEAGARVAAGATVTTFMTVNSRPRREAWRESATATTCSSTTTPGSAERSRSASSSPRTAA